DEVLLVEEQPLPVAASPTNQSPSYIPESNPEEDPEEDEEEEPCGDDADDEEEDEEDEQDEEEEHSAPADSVPPPPIHCMTARISIRAR
ncbi:hypothetical protein Tco_0594433, partial [Tanacetum coccineum]